MSPSRRKVAKTEDEGKAGAEEFHDPDDGHEDGCAECGDNHPFELPDQLLEAALAGRLVVFAGAGVSTESRRRIGGTFYDSIAADVGDSVRPDTSFPELMTMFEVQRGRRELLSRIRERLEYIRTFADLKQAATRFHQELATAYFLSDIVTTNWDTYFEDHTGALPLVVPEDYAFWDLPGRKVFKLHGSMHNLSSIVATTEDYDRCYKRLRTNVIGSSLKHMLATKSVVFIGYSLTDSDLLRILAFMRRQMGSLLPRSWIVTPHGYSGELFPSDRIIQTDGRYFLRQLKGAAVAKGAMVPDSTYGGVALLAERLNEAGYKSVAGADINSRPAEIYNWCYQDGMRHALDRVEARLPSGYYSKPGAAHGVLHTYRHAFEGAVHTGNLWDASYILGYMNGLALFGENPPHVDAIPLYFVWGAKSAPKTYEQYVKEVARTERRDPEAHHKAAKLVAQAGGLHPQHTPYLDVEALVAAAPALKKPSKSRTQGKSARR